MPRPSLCQLRSQVGRFAVALLFATPLAACGASATGAPHVASARASTPRVFSAATIFPGGVVEEAGALTLSFMTESPGEALVDLVARVPDADWEASGREAATVRLSVDGVYNQDVVLYQGDRTHTYRLALGALAPGAHTLTVERLAEFSAPGLLRVEIERGAVAVVGAEHPEYDVFAHAPIVQSREAPHLTDTPLLLTYERGAELDGGHSLRYTLVLSNEDGGTATPALMARWGRTVDIDWAYAIRWASTGAVKSETYQGRLHFTRRFSGRYEGRHPILRLSTENNCYDDGGSGPLRFRLAPHTRLDRAGASREEVLDRHPWIFALMAKELFRERKAHKDHYPPFPNLQKDAIADPRRFVFVEFQQRSRGRGVGVEIKLKGVARPASSHRGDSGLTAERDGWCRVAVELPAAAPFAEVERIDLVGLGRGSATVSAVRRVHALDEAFAPVSWPVVWQGTGLLENDTHRVRVYQAP